MKCFNLLRLAVALIAAALPFRAHAQSLSPNVEMFVDGREIKNDPIIYVTKNQCAESRFRFRVTGYTAIINNLEVWASQSDTDCASSAGRAVTGTTTRSCWLVASRTGVSERADFNDIEGGQIFRASGAADAETCPESRGNRFRVFFVPLASPTDSNPNSPPNAVTGVGPVASPQATLTLFTALPDAPTDVKGGSGEVRLSLSWDKSASAMSMTEYRAYFDGTVGSDATCANSVIRAGEAPATGLADMPGVTRKNTKQGLSTSLGGLDELGVAVGNYVAAAVVTIDPAGNESVFSERVCIQRVNTVSFADACNDDPSCKDGFDSCSVHAPGASSGRTLGLSLLLALGVALGARRRRHV